MSNICAFVLTWCLFVGNSRQTTSSVPWHRAPKYDRKHNLHLTMKWFLFKWLLNWCMCRQKGLRCILWKYSLDSGGVQNAQIVKTALTKNSFQPSVLHTICYLHGMFDSTSSSRVVPHLFLRFQTVVLQDGQTLLCFVVFWFYFEIHKSNQNHAKHFIVCFYFVYFLFFNLNIWTHLANQHMVHPILNPLLKTWLTFGHNCMRW